MTSFKQAARALSRDPSLGRHATSPDRRKRTVRNDPRRSVSQSAGEGPVTRLREIASLDEDASEVVEPFAQYKLLDSEFDDLPDCSRSEISRWLGCPTGAAINADNWDA